MKTKIICFAAIFSSALLLTSCNSQEKKIEKTDVTTDSNTVIRPDTTSSTDVTPPNNVTADNIYVVSLTPEFDIIGNDGKDWDTKVFLNIILDGETIAYFDGLDKGCCSGGKKGESPNPTDWNPRDHIPYGIKTLPRYILNRADITKDKLANSFANLGWQPVGKDECTGIRWTITATFSDNTRAVYLHPETFANQSGLQERKIQLKNCIQ